MCAEPIAAQAIKCKHCKSVLVPGLQETSATSQRVSISGITTPVLISAICNIIVGLFWLSTCLGVVLAVPMFIMSLCEFIFYATADPDRPKEAASNATLIGWLEIIVGLFNLVSFICGIIVLINASKVKAKVA